MTGSRSGEHRLAFHANLDHLPHDAGLWQDGAVELQPAGAILQESLSYALQCVLTPRQRQVVELFFFEGQSQGEIARRLGVSQQVVQKCLYGDRRQGRLVGGALSRLRGALTPVLEAMQHPEPLEIPQGEARAPIPSR